MKKIAESHSQHTFTFDALISKPYTFKLVHAAHLDIDEREIIQIKLEADLENFSEVLNAQWFNYHPEVALHSAQFTNDGPIVITLVLAHSFTVQLLQNSYELEHFLAALYKVNSDGVSAVAQQENWFLVEAKQQLDTSDFLPNSEGSSLSIGFKTSWYSVLLEELILERKLSTPVAPVDTLISEVTRLLTEQRIEYQLEQSDNKEQFDVYIEFTLADQKWNEIIRVNETDKIITCYAKFPDAVPLDQLDQIALVLMNENYSLVNGAFELDYDDGDLRFRTTILAYELSNMSQLAHVLGEHMNIMKQYIPAIKQYISTN